MEQIQKIVFDDMLTKQEKIDKLFEMDSIMYTNLGTDSTDEEVQEVKDKSLSIYKYIKLLDEHVGKQLLSNM
jgi:hypothetical protein